MKKEERSKKIKKMRRAKRVRTKILAVKNLPRLTVFRSNKYIYAQIIDDKLGKTLAFASEKELKDRNDLNKSQRAEEVGKIIAKKAGSRKIKNVVFDKGPYHYHGRIKRVADGAREGGLVF